MMTCEGQVLGDDDIHLWPESRDFLWKIKRLRPSENITEWGSTLAQPWINHQLLSLSSNPKKMHPESKMHRDNQLRQFQLHQFMCHVNGRFLQRVQQSKCTAETSETAQWRRKAMCKKCCLSDSTIPLFCPVIFQNSCDCRTVKYIFLAMDMWVTSLTALDPEDSQAFCWQLLVYSKIVHDTHTHTRTHPLLLRESWVISFQSFCSKPMRVCDALELKGNYTKLWLSAFRTGNPNVLCRF